MTDVCTNRFFKVNFILCLKIVINRNGLYIYIYRQIRTDQDSYVEVMTAVLMKSIKKKIVYWVLVSFGGISVFLTGTVFVPC